jgi:hypothetical protein
VLLRALTVGEEAGAFEDEIDADVAMREGGRVFLGGHAHALAVDDQVVAVGADFAGISAMDGVALEQQGV